jgi:hypothetical protein
MLSFDGGNNNNERKADFGENSIMASELKNKKITTTGNRGKREPLGWISKHQTRKSLPDPDYYNKNNKLI